MTEYGDAMSPSDVPEQPQQMIPPVEPVRRMTETERVLMNEVMYAQAAAVAAQNALTELQGKYATLLGAYKRQTSDAAPDDLPRPTTTYAIRNEAAG